MIKPNLHLLMLIAIISASCSSSEVLPTLPVSNAAPTAVPLLSAGAPPTGTAISTNSPLPTATPSPTGAIATSAITQVDESILKYQPLPVSPNAPADAMLSGTLILSGQHPYRLNLEHRAQDEMSNDVRFLGVSPNRKWLAYYQQIDAGTSWLVVETANGQQIAKLPMNEDWVSYTESGAWLNNERLVFNLWKDRLSSQVPGIYPSVAVNPFTDDYQDLALDYPDLRPTIGGPAGTLHFVYSTVVYNPSLTSVVYPQTTPQGTYIVLWDRQSQKALARIEDLNEFGHAPLWSPNGEWFVVAVSYQLGKPFSEWTEEWLSVGQDGQIRRLTQFTDFFDYARISTATFSPNGQSLAFWLDTKPGLCEGQHLAVLEMEALHVTDYCVPGSIYGDAPPPIWSPDSRYIAVQNYYEDNFSHVILVDTEQGWAAEIGENAYPVGWLAGP